VLAFSNGLAPGLYRVHVGSPLTDLAENVAQPATWTFRVLGTIDTDQDGVPDSLEVFLGLDPLNPDTNGNGVLDGDEDPDGDGLSTKWELAFGYDPTRRDSDNNLIDDGQEDPDGDGLKNVAELAAGTDPRNPDTDGDGWNDEAEVSGGGDPTNPSVTPNHGFVAQPAIRVIVQELATYPSTPY